MNLTAGIIVATYNGEKFIIEQLESLKNQTYPLSQVIISDDGSTDSTVKLVTDFIEQNHLSNWQLNINKVNKGYAKNFLDAAMSAVPEVLFFCDQDDIWKLDKVGLMVEAYEKNPDMKMMASDLELWYVDDDAVHWSAKDTATMNDSKTMEKITFSPASFQCQRSGCTMSIRKDFLHNIYPYWVSGWAHDEFVWKCAILLDCCGIYHYRGIKRRMHSNNVTNVKIRTREKRIKQIMYEKNAIDSMAVLLQSSYARSIESHGDKERLLENLNRYNALRMQCVKNHNLLAWLKLYTHYQECYPSKNTMLMDAYLAIFNSYKKK